MSNSLKPIQASTVNTIERRRLIYVCLVIAASFAVLSLSTADTAVFSMVMPRIKTELHFSDAELGLLSGLPFALCFALFGLPAAWLGDTRFGRTSVASAAVAIWSVMTVLCGVATGFWSLFFLRMGVGAGEGGGQPAVMSVVTDIAPQRWRRRVIAICGMGAIFGSVLGLVGSGWAVTRLGWRPAFLVMGTPGILVALCYFLIVKEPPRSDAAQVSRNFFLEIRNLFSSRSFLLLFIGASLMIWLISAIGAWIPTFLSRAHNINMTQIGGILGVATAISGIAAPTLYGWLGDRLTAKDLRWPLRLCSLSFATAVVIFIFVLNVANTAVLYVLLVSFQFLIHGLSPLTIVAAQDAAPTLKATALATMSVGSTVLGAFSPWIVGTISDRFSNLGDTESLRLGLLAVTPVALLGAISLWAAAQSLAPPLRPGAATAV